MKHRETSKLGAFTLLFALQLAFIARPDDFGPWSADPRHPTLGETERPDSLQAPAQSESTHPFGFAFRFYSELLTRVDGPRCAHRPTCAVFAIRAMERYGLPLGPWLALDRLMRGARSSLTRTLPLIAGPGGVFFADTLDDNAFWEPGYLPMSGR